MRVLERDLRAEIAAALESNMACKTGDKDVGPAARYFTERAPIPVFCQVHLCGRHFQSDMITVLPLARSCRERGLL